MVLSSAIVFDHDRRMADDRRSMFPYDRRRSQTLLRSAICDHMETSLYVLSSAIVCDHDRRIADDRRTMFPYDRRRSQTLLRSAICDHAETSLNDQITNELTTKKRTTKEHFLHKKNQARRNAME